MYKSEYRNIFENEEKHFFYVASHDLVLSLVQKYLDGSKILDTGCGTGLLAKKLARFGHVTTIDIESEAIKFAKKRGVTAIKASVNRLPFKNNSFDLVTSIDVIYHRAVNDQKALSEFYRVLKPKGILILRVPANPHLLNAHDKVVATRERYTKEVLEKRIKKAGFRILKLSYVNAVLFPLRLASHFIDKYFPSTKALSGISRVPSLFNLSLSKLLVLENRIIEKVNLPIGIGLVAVCSRNKIAAGKKTG